MNFKALNFDNDVELDQTIALFRTSYGDSFPIRKIYSAAYWKENGGERFKTILAVEGRQVVGTVSVRPEPGNPTLAQLAYLASSPDLQISDSRPLAELIRTAAHSFGARYLYTAVPSHLPAINQMTAALTPTVSILPEYLYNLHPNSSAKGIAASVAMGAGALPSNSSSATQPQIVYVPSAHREIVTSLLAAAQISRDVVSDLNSNSRNSSISAEARGLEIKYFPRVRALQIMIQPSLLSADEVRELESRRYRRSFIFVNASDPAVPVCAAKLEALGYYFSGFVPAILGGQDGLVYCSIHPGAVEKEAFVNAETVSFVEYLQRHTPTNTNGQFSISNGVSANA